MRPSRVFGAALSLITVFRRIAESEDERRTVNQIRGRAYFSVIEFMLSDNEVLAGTLRIDLDFRPDIAVDFITVLPARGISCVEIHVKVGGGGTGAFLLRDVNTINVFYIYFDFKQPIFSSFDCYMNCRDARDDFRHDCLPPVRCF